MNLVSMKCRAITSRGCPFRSYMARKNSGIIITIITMVAALTPMGFRSKKNVGMPNSTALPKQMSCRLVRLNRSLLLTLDKSLGTDINAAIENTS